MKNKKVLVSILIVLGVAVIAGGMFLLFSGQGKSNKKVFSEAIKTRTNGLKKLFADNKTEKPLNVKFDLTFADLKGSFDSFIKGEEVYLKLNMDNTPAEVYLKGGKVYFKSPETGPDFYYMDMDLDVSDDKVDDIFKDVKEEDIKKEDAEITINGKKYKTVKYSYEFTEKQIKDIANQPELKGEESLVQIDKVKVDLFIYNDEVIKTTITSGMGEDKISVVVEDVVIDEKAYYNFAILNQGLKFGEVKVNEVTRNNYDIRVVAMGQEIIGGSLVKDDNRIALNLKDPDSTMKLDLLITKNSENDYNATLTVEALGEKLSLVGSVKEVDAMPSIDVSNAKPMDEAGGIPIRNLPIPSLT